MSAIETKAYAERDVAVGPYTMHVAESGDPSLPPVIRLHGSGPGVTSLLYLPRHARLRRVIAPGSAAGREDQMLPVAGSSWLAERIPNAQLHVFGKTGHWTQIEQADAFRFLVDAFFHDRI